MVLCFRMKYTVRKAENGDTAAITEICFLTLDSNDERFREIAGLHWAIPYLRYEIEHCFTVVGGENKPLGYILSSPNAEEFRKQFRPRMKKELSRAFRKQWRNLSPGLFIREYLESTRYIDTLPGKLEKEYPAHLHINIHPDYQGLGLGVMLIDALREHLREIGCPGIHLGVGKKNSGAIRFYERNGFRLLKNSFEVLYYGIKL